MSAITTTLLTFLQLNDKIVFTGKGYRNIRSFCFDILKKHGVCVVTLPLLNNTCIYDIIADECAKNLKVVFIESPSNPHLFLVEIKRIRDIVGASCIIIVDSTFSTSVNFQPVKFGADLVIHSCGKYIGGHADIMAGSVAGRSFLIEQIRKTRNILGSIVDPNTAFLLNRSLSTLRMRIEHLNSSGQKLAEYLSSNKHIGRVFYTGLTQHPQYSLGERYLSGHGGVVTFEILNESSKISNIIDKVEIPYMGTNFGSSHSMIEQLSIFTYYNQTEKERDDLGITDNLIRYSIGFEDNIDDIIYDLEIAIEDSFK